MKQATQNRLRNLERQTPEGPLMLWLPCDPKPAGWDDPQVPGMRLEVVVVDATEGAPSFEEQMLAQGREP